MKISSIRRIGELFIYTYADRFSIYTRFSIPMAILVMAIVSMCMDNQGIMFTIYGYLIIILSLLLCRTLTKSFRGLLLPFLFMVIGFSMHLFAKALGYPTSTIYSLILSSFKIALIFLSITLFLQWINLKEVRHILNKLGLRRTSSYLSIVFTTMPILLHIYSESYVATMLKLGKKKIYKAVKPLIVQAAILAKDMTQAVYLYGISEHCKISLKKPMAIEIVVVIAIIVLGIHLLIFMP